MEGRHQKISMTARRFQNGKKIIEPLGSEKKHVHLVGWVGGGTLTFHPKPGIQEVPNTTSVVENGVKYQAL